MECPKCKSVQNDANTQCAQCGIVFSKFYAQQADPDYRQKIRQRQRRKYHTSNVDPAGWKYIFIGVSTGIVLTFMDMWFVNMTLGILVTLIHEMGHTVMAWIFGIPAIPAFDFMHGGGLTINFQQETTLLVAIYAFGLFLAYTYRNNFQTLLIIIGLGCLHAISIMTSLSNILILFMGHGVELLIAALFIYRSLTNTSIIHSIERPLYSILGFYIIFHDIAFSWKLINDAGYRVEYEAQKGGYHFGDFSRIAEQYLHVDMSSVAAFFLLCSLIIPILAILTWRHHEQLLNWIDERLQFETR